MFFCAGYHEHQPAKSPDQLCRGRYGGRHGVELAHPCAGAICPTGAVVICSGGGRILARHSVSAGAGPRCAPYAPGQHRRRPHVNLKRTTMLVLAVTLHNIPEDIAVGVVNAGWVSGMVGHYRRGPGPCYPELPRRRNHFDAAVGRRPEQAPRVLVWGGIRRGGSH